jgi:ATP-dependent Lhr-like helicase
MPPVDRTGFHRLAPPLQRWLWEQGWSGLREAQAAALPLLLDSEKDVVIAAATASGKTEAAFLPLLTRLWRGEGKGLLLYVAPMKALINDQFERLGLICERLDLPVTPWHGDVGEAPRKRFFADPRGVVLITPESLESLLFRRGAELGHLFAGLEAVVVDELHAFIGDERGVSCNRCCIGWKRPSADARGAWGCRRRWATWDLRPSSCGRVWKMRRVARWR